MSSKGGFKGGVRGMEGAIAMTAFMEAIAVTKVSGAALQLEQRSGASNAEIINYLAGRTANGSSDGSHKGPVRDISCDTKEINKVGKLYIRIVSRRLSKLSKLSTHGTASNLTEALRTKYRDKGKDAAERANKAAFIKSGKLMAHIMAKKIESGGFPAPSPAYAKRRNKLYGVGPGESLIASGRLLRNLKSGSFRLLYDLNRGYFKTIKH